MCRICGIYDFSSSPQNLEETITAMRDTMTHGGPDDAGVYVHWESGLALGHRRLSILDLSERGHQPMTFEHLTIVHNGEIYNYQEVRQKLETQGYSFQSDTDTEVVLKAFHCWGKEALHHFRGMFAFAIWNEHTKELTLCRDRIGVKPLFWSFRDGLFLFSSELKAFHKHPRFQKEISSKGLAMYLHYGYVVAPDTIFSHTHKLLPGHLLTVNARGEVHTECYWNIRYFFEKGLREREVWLKRREEELVEELEGLLEESFQFRMIAHVPVGVFLSGGLDSTLVTALLAKRHTNLKTFTIGFSESDYNEAPWAKKVAEHLGTDHTELYCTPQEALEIIPKLPELYDEPFGDSSAIPTHLVALLAKRQVKVALSADGGDEQFCGYTRYWMVGQKVQKLRQWRLFLSLLRFISPEGAAKLYQIFRPLLPKWPNFLDKFRKLQQVLQADDSLEGYDLSFHYFLCEDLRTLGVDQPHRHHSFFEPFSEAPLMINMMAYDIRSYLPDDILVKVDRATMGCALEGRDPLLDHKILEFTAQLPLEWKWREGKSKHLVRKILAKYIPQSLIDRPKQGFGVPIRQWFQNELASWYREYLDPVRIQKGGIFSPQAVQRLLDDYFHNRGVNPHKLWFLFVFELWREKWL